MIADFFPGIGFCGGRGGVEVQDKGEDGGEKSEVDEGLAGFASHSENGIFLSMLDK